MAASIACLPSLRLRAALNGLRWTIAGRNVRVPWLPSTRPVVIDSAHVIRSIGNRRTRRVVIVLRNCSVVS
jgi:hypothetical protein